MLSQQVAHLAKRQALRWSVGGGHFKLEEAAGVGNPLLHHPACCSRPVKAEVSETSSQLHSFKALIEMVGQL